MAYEVSPFFRHPVASPQPVPALLKDETEAIPLGQIFDMSNGHEESFSFNQHTSILLFGPNNSGKGMRVLAPILLQTYGKRSIVVIDPKGEQFALSAPFRRHPRVGRVVVFNPFNLHLDRPGFEDARSEGYNPLLSLDHTSPSFNADVAMLAEALVPIVGKNEPYWDLSARALVSALIMWTVLEARGAVKPFVIDRFHRYITVPTIARVRELLCQASGVNEDPASKLKPKLPYGLPALAKEMMDTEYPGLRNKAGAFTNWERDIQSVARTAMTHLEPLDDEPISRDLEKGNYDIRDLKQTPTTIYVILPAGQMERHSKWLRLVVSSALKACLRDRQPWEPRVLFMLDEFYALGHMEIIQKNWALSRGYHVQIMPVLQNLGQLKHLYDSWDTFIANAGATLWFAPSDIDSAEWLSKRCGQATRETTSSNFTSTTTFSSKDGKDKSGDTTTTTGFSNTTSKMSVPAIRPHDLLDLPVGAMVMTLYGMANPAALYAPGWWQSYTCERRVIRENPYHTR